MFEYFESKLISCVYVYVNKFENWFYVTREAKNINF